MSRGKGLKGQEECEGEGIKFKKFMSSVILMTCISIHYIDCIKGL